jgi:hypothetical protein
MSDWITTGERPLPRFVAPFAKPSSGGKGGEDDDKDEDDEDDDEDDEDDDLADLTDDELRDELKAARASLSKAGGSVKSKRDKIKRLNRELEEARTPKPKKKTADEDDDGPDLDTIRHEAKSEGEKAGLARAKKAEAKSSLLAGGVNPERVTRAVGLLELDDMDLDDDGLDGIDDAIEDLRKEWPELFAKKRTKRQSVAGDRDSDGDASDRSARRSTKTASELAGAQLLGKSV